MMRGIRHVDAHFHHRRGHENLRLVVGKGAHRRIFLVGLHAAVHQAQLELREDVLLQARVFFHRGLRFDLVGLFDQRADDERLPPFFDLRADERISALALGGQHDARLDRLAARRHLIDHREIEIAVEGQRQRARNGRGRHHQHVRTVRGPSAARRRAAPRQSDAARR